MDWMDNKMIWYNGQWIMKFASGFVVFNPNQIYDTMIHTKCYAWYPLCIADCIKIRIIRVKKCTFSLKNQHKIFRELSGEDAL